MQNKPLVILLLIIGGIALLAIGCYGGILFQKQKTAPQLEKATKLTELTKSKIIPSIMAIGEITNISDRTITLGLDEESLTVPISEEATIFAFGFPSAEAPESVSEVQQIRFEDLRVGDGVNVNLKILEDGGLEGTYIMVTPSLEGIPTPSE